MLGIRLRHSQSNNGVSVIFNEVDSPIAALDTSVPFLFVDRTSLILSLFSLFFFFFFFAYERFNLKKFTLKLCELLYAFYCYKNMVIDLNAQNGVVRMIFR